MNSTDPIAPAKRKSAEPTYDVPMQKKQKSEIYKPTAEQKQAIQKAITDAGINLVEDVLYNAEFDVCDQTFIVVLLKNNPFDDDEDEHAHCDPIMDALDGLLSKFAEIIRMDEETLRNSHIEFLMKLKQAEEQRLIIISEFVVYVNDGNWDPTLL